MAPVRVAVRVRPLNKREKRLSSKVIVQLKGNTATIVKLSPSVIRGNGQMDRGKSFSYDFSYDSTDRKSPSFAAQEKIFQDLGTDVLKAAFEGFNACIFAYGQTGTGKSYTMMGDIEDKGLIPRICEHLFCEISKRSKSDAVSFRTEVSYLQIYNERVQDLLKRRPTVSENRGLRVREHPVNGPYVENLSQHLVCSYGDVEELMMTGNANRTTASTAMNDISSRSHAIFTIRFTQALFNAELPCETLSKIHLVDLAGSERADATHATAVRLKEGANINKSLVTLGSVISALADLSDDGQMAKRKKQLFIPYRDSVLTWLLKDSLGGNSKTIMIATISPADVNYMETLSTLRYASRAKSIVNSPVVNEDGSVRVIRELRAEIAKLRGMVEQASQAHHRNQSASLKVEERLAENEAKEEKLALRKRGHGVVLDSQLPHLIGIDEDLLSTGIIFYHLKMGRTLVGSDEASRQHIVLRGLGLLSEHCVLENCGGIVRLIPHRGALCSVNGMEVTEPCKLTQGAIIELGQGTMFCFNHPKEAAQLRKTHEGGPPSTLSPSKANLTTFAKNLAKVLLLNPGMDESAAAAAAAAADADSGLPSSSVLSTSLQMCMTTAMPGNCPVSHSGLELDGDTPQGGVSTRDGQEQEKHLSHKSGQGFMSERLWRRADTETGVEICGGGEIWSGDASLQQTSVLGLGDGCCIEPEGNANESQGVVADCYRGCPGSDGSSLGSMSHLQSTKGTSSRSFFPQASPHSQLSEKTYSNQAVQCPPDEAALKGQFSPKKMDESSNSEGISRECEVGVRAVAEQKSGLFSLVSRVSWMVQDAGRLLWSAPWVLQKVRKAGLEPIRAIWSSQVVSQIKENPVLSIVKDSHVFALVKESNMLSMVKKLLMIQHIRMKFTQDSLPKKAEGTVQSPTNPSKTLTLTQIQKGTEEIELPHDSPCTREEKWSNDSSIREVELLKQHGTIDICSKQKQSMMKEFILAGKQSCVPRGPYTAVNKDLQATAVNDSNLDLESQENLGTVRRTNSVQIFCQTLIEFPDALMNLQPLSQHRLVDSLQSVISTSLFSSQKMVALFWLSVAKCSQPQPQPALLIMTDSFLYTLTSDPGSLVLFHHLSLLQLKEVQVGFAGQSVCFMGTTEESVLVLHTRSKKLTQELCSIMLGVICPRDSRVSQHPLFHGDLMEMSLDWQTDIPELLLDSGLRVYCHFQKTLANLVYLLHGNMNQPRPSIGEVRLLLYTSVRVSKSPETSAEHLAQLLLTDTHLCLVQEHTVFHPAPKSVQPEPHRSQFKDLTLCCRSDIRCVLVHSGDKRGSTRLNVIMSHGRARSHSESVTKVASPPPLDSHPSPQTEVWRLTFGCSAEVACLINHLSMSEP